MYVRWSIPNGSYEVGIFSGQDSSGTLKSVSIPCLEPYVAPLVVWTIKRCFRPNDWTVAFCTDCLFALLHTQYFRRSLAAFIANMFTVIQDRAEVDNSVHVKPTDNPYDSCCRRVISARPLKHGPTPQNLSACLRSTRPWAAPPTNPSQK